MSENLNKPKIAILLHKAQKYRIPIFDILSKEYNITLFCDNADDFEERHNITFKKITLHNYGPFIVHKPSILRSLNNYDVVIGLHNIRCLDLLLLGILPFRKYKIIYWGIGVAASYKKKFDQDDSLKFIRYFMAKIADSIIFYSEYPKNKYIKNGINEEKIFIANNTVKILKNQLEFDKLRNELLFIGTLYKEKGVEELLEHYLAAYSKIGDAILKLNIVGDGELLEHLKELTIKNKINHKVKFLGAVYDEKILDEIFSSTIACISPNQAGLSVLSSMGRGVPFITCSDAITGGEIFNIKNGENGIVYQNPSDLIGIITEASTSHDKFLKMGKHARIHYQNHRLPEMMAKGIGDAIKFTLKK